MTITFLGTGTSQGVPVIGCNCGTCTSLDFRDKRLRSSIHIQIKDKSYVIDTGPDFRMQMLREGIKQLDAIIYTHEHKDHTAGLDDIRPFNFMQMKDMPIYGTKPVLDQIRKEFSYVFSPKKYPGVPQIITHEISNEPFEVLGTTFCPIEVLHYKLPVFGYRIHDFTYITDAKYISEVELKKIKGTKVLVLNALQIKEHLSHLTLAEALQIIEIIKPEKAYLTHISHRLGIHADIEKDLPENVFLAHDGLKITFDQCI
ncbi:MBL fold metallo-hydrolase [Echinicola sp. CAU 1574]|uniref:MBL fold metallo-hydrolase n=1 Tax=Echinicola arenosa TaxID=2774144 RepID=A0ABR9AFK0_9BACT|nr:MBL fold metallo-hydrolase [Echinicola arenosa]MBD8487620.1 MBL fold metallo-hydrolase [Echinicola arenosa]